MYIYNIAWHSILNYISSNRCILNYKSISNKVIINNLDIYS